jgi:hypothetical protein
LDGAEVSITENTMHTFSWGAIVVTQEGHVIPGERSQIVIRDNKISTDGFLGIEVGNLRRQTIKPDFDLLIEENTITKGDDPTGRFPNLAGIQIATGEEGARVRDNIIRGDGNFGILADHVNNSVFSGNDLRSFTPVEAHYGLIDSHDNTVVLEGDETVLDLGSGNMIIRDDDIDDGADSDVEIAADLDGSQEVPAVVTSMRGEVEVKIEDGQLEFALEVSSNTHDIFAAHIHCASPGINGPVGVTLFTGSFTDASGTLAEGTVMAPEAGNACGWIDIAAVTAAIQSGNTYVNVHTTAASGGVPSGEIRGNLPGSDDGGE